MGLGEVAAAIHRDMCEDNANGYSWSPRWGEDGLGPKTLTIGGRQYTYDRGSYECGTSCTTAWRAALAHTSYARSLDGYVSTHTMREVYTSTGLFEWKPMSFLAEPGDLYLNIQNHVAMCQTQYPDILSEFCINEQGGTYGGQVGDQTGYESYVHDYYDGEWDGILHYNGKADNESIKPPDEWPVWLYQLNTTAAQRWKLNPQKDGTYELVSAANGMALDVYGSGTKKETKVQAYKRNNTKAQRWRFIRATKSPSGAKYAPADMAPFTLAPSCAPTLRLDVRGANKADGTAIQIYTANGTNAQMWVPMDNGDGTYTLINVATGKALDLKGGGK